MAVYILYYCRGHEQLAEPGGWGLVYGGREVLWLYMFSCIIVEVMNGWLSQEGGIGFKVEGESCGCIYFVLL